VKSSEINFVIAGIFFALSIVSFSFSLDEYSREIKRAETVAEFAEIGLTLPYSPHIPYAKIGAGIISLFIGFHFLKKWQSLK